MKALALALLVACGKDAPPPPAPAPVAPGLSLAVTIDGTPATWGPDVFARVPHTSVKNNSGEARDAWSLRELAKVAGPTASVTAVIGAQRREIDAGAWADTSKLPLVHRTRRGSLKFRWTDATGAWNDAETNDVTGLALTRGAP